MKNKRLVIGLTSIVILIASLTVMLLDIFIPLKLWTHPVLNLLFCMFIGFGVLSLTLAIKSKSPWYFFLSAILLGLSIFYVLMQYVKWWIALIVLVLMLVIVAIVSVIIAGNKTEDIALNKSKDYKDYEQRREEKLAKEKEERPVELPEIKSFK